MKKNRSTWDPGQLLLGDFHLERKLGEGGMGAVYLVRSRSTGERFAVKKTHLRDPAAETAFLTELQTWIDLPDHPHLAACRFFRTVAGEIVIFAEFVEGGSLADRIQARQLTRLDDILDAAIQTAWGLHAAHECGLVHQDVKPGNVLVSAEGTAKVSDFGLARARAAGGERPPGVAGGLGVSSLTRLVRRITGRSRPHRDSLVSCGGMTVAYRSPEQAAGLRLSRRTDVWSWGLAVLEMFTGEVTWLDGQAAPAVLEAYLDAGPMDTSRPAMPLEMAEVLRRSFQLDPDDRWQTLAEAADAVRRIYRQTLGRDHPRPAPGELSRGGPATAAASPKDGRRWLENAVREQGRDPAAAEYLMPPRTGSRRAQAIADIAAMAEAARIYEELIAAGRTDLVPRLASLYHEKAGVHEIVKDFPGALLLRRQVIQLFERTVEELGRDDFLDALGGAHLNHGYTLWLGNDNREALAAYDRALDCFQRLVNRVESEEAAEKLAHDLAEHLALVYLNKAAALSRLGEYRESLALYDQGKTILGHLAKEGDRPELLDKLASAHMGEAGDLERLGRYRHAGYAYDEAITLRERLVNQEGRGEFALTLSQTYTNKAIMLRKLDQPREAAELFDKVISLRERLVKDEGRRELLDGLARAYGYKADVLSDLREHDAARELYDRSIGLWQQLVNREGQGELAHELAMAYLHKGNCLMDLKDYAAAIVEQDRGLAILQRLIEEEGCDHLAPDLAGHTMNKCHALKMQGAHADALALFDRVIAIWRRLIEEKGRRELAPELAKAFGNKGKLAESMKDYQAALALYDQAAQLYERLITQERWSELKGDLAAIWVDRAAVRGQIGDRVAAVVELDAAIPILKEEVARKDAPKLREKLEMAESLREITYWLHRLRDGDTDKQARAVEDLFSRLADTGQKSAATEDGTRDDHS